MIEECHLKQDELGDRVSKNRSTVTNYLRLLKLPPSVQASIRDGVISMGHAKALLTLDDPTKQIFYHQHIVKQGLSVRSTEELVRDAQRSAAKKEVKKNGAISFQVQKIQDDLASKFSSRVKLKVDQQGKGIIEIPFLSQDDLGRILEIMDW
jgi:ParB family transcriptional regulator, chromosome partitioning protein